MQEQMMNNRDKSLDSIKFFLIFCVIVGHLIEPSRYVNKASASLYSIIYVFHMPLFILLSGYFSKGTDLGKITKQSSYLLETFFVIALFQCVYTYSITPVINPENSSWYLLSLICWKYIACFIDRCRSWHMSISWGIFGIILLFPFFMPASLAKYDTAFSFMRATQFLPFFMIGYYLRKEDIDKLRNMNVGFKVGIVTLLLLIIILAIIYSGRPLHILEFQRNSLPNLLLFLPIGVAGILFAKLGMYLSSLIFCLFFLSVNFQEIKLFERYGKHTLFFFTFQALVIHFIVYFSPLPFTSSIIFSFCFIVLSCFIVRYEKIITNPFSYLKNLNRKNGTVK